jgi:hypothetical protein
MGSGLPASSVTSPTNSGLNALKERVADSVGMGGEDRALQLAESGINNAIRRLNGRLWSWATTTADITTVASQGDYTATDGVPTDYKGPRSLMLLDSSSQEVRRLVWVDPKIFEAEYQDRSADGTPLAYTIKNIHDNLTLYLSTLASASWVASNPTMRLRYYKRLGYYAGNGSLQIPSEAELMIEYFARAEIASVVRPGSAHRLDAIWREQEVELKRAEVRDSLGDYD